ncbi:TetR/AcrR family transcriptional regulator [Aerolutibacter daejeonensis]|uniref:TetR/AcrR family transcriptional regulator n=1 Tax=Aerolutibacter daejeonensis TaxID=346181 RepID=UPI000A6868E3|nr:TetR/AcrR family transcriptional regulator [Lysobacter daejeonensis]
MRERLLDAAIACYVRQGIAGASLRMIATEAGTTPALLHYYFGDKQQLQEAVAQERVLPTLGIVIAEMTSAGDDIAAVIAAFVRGVGKAVASAPWLPPLWVREVLCEGGALRGLLVDTIVPKVPALLVQRLAQAQRKGGLNPDLDPRLLVVSLVGLTLFPAASAGIWKSVFGAHDVTPDMLHQHTIALLDRGLELRDAK